MPEFDFRTIYVACAALGGAVLVLQTLLLLFGHGDAEGGADAAHDVPHDAGHEHDDGGLQLVSVRTVAAFVAFFGLAGWGAQRAGWNAMPSLALALGAGLVMLVVVAWLFSLHRRLAGSGTLEPARAVGMTATVYTNIPANNTDKGKIHVALQGRTAEYLACTNGARMLATGTQVRVVRQITSDTFEVEPLA